MIRDLKSFVSQFTKQFEFTVFSLQDHKGKGTFMMKSTFVTRYFIICHTFDVTDTIRITPLKSCCYHGNAIEMLNSQIAST